MTSIEKKCRNFDRSSQKVCCRIWNLSLNWNWNWNWNWWLINVLCLCLRLIFNENKIKLIVFNARNQNINRVISTTIYKCFIICAWICFSHFWDNFSFFQCVAHKFWYDIKFHLFFCFVDVANNINFSFFRYFIRHVWNNFLNFFLSVCKFRRYNILCKILIVLDFVWN